MVQYLQIAIIYILRVVLRIFYIFPVNAKKVMFNSYQGRQYSCNPKYIFEYMYEHYGDKYQYIWCINDKNKMPENYSGVKMVKYLSFDYIFTILTAKYFIANVSIGPIFPMRKQQVVVNTWHGGGAYKRVGIESETFRNRAKFLQIATDIRAYITNCIVSSCEKFTRCIAKDIFCPESIFMSIGMPRNDIFFDKQKYELARDKVYKYFGISKECSIVLYAPTYRGDYGTASFHNASGLYFSLNVEFLLKKLKDKFRYDFLFLFRTHYIYANNGHSEQQTNIISAIEYPDMQELLCAADVLITDYSSSIWDFSFTYKPCFLYAPDLSSYMKERGFYTPVESWPFPFSGTNAELIENIGEFDQNKYIELVKKHHHDLGSYEKGTATKVFCEKYFE